MNRDVQGKKTFGLVDIEAGLSQSLDSRRAIEVLSAIRKARVYRLIAANQAEQKRLIKECDGLHGPEWMERQEKITALFAAHHRLEKEAVS
jgi:hypothetical protein